MKKTGRGFNVFADAELVNVVESSLAYEGAHVRIYGGRDADGHVQLNVAQARLVSEALNRFIEMAVADELTEPEVREEADEATL